MYAVWFMTYWHPPPPLPSRVIRRSQQRTTALLLWLQCPNITLRHFIHSPLSTLHNNHALRHESEGFICFGTFQSAAAETPDAPYSVTEEKLQECRHGDNDEDCFLLLLVPCLEREGVEGKLVKPNPPRGVIFSAGCAVQSRHIAIIWPYPHYPLYTLPLFTLPHSYQISNSFHGNLHRNNITPTIITIAHNMQHII